MFPISNCKGLLDEAWKLHPGKSMQAISCCPFLTNDPFFFFFSSMSNFDIFCLAPLKKIITVHLNIYIWYRPCFISPTIITNKFLTTILMVLAYTFHKLVPLNKLFNGNKIPNYYCCIAVFSSAVSGTESFYL